MIDGIERRLTQRPYDSPVAPTGMALTVSNLIAPGLPNYTVGPAGVIVPSVADPAPPEVWTRGTITVLGANTPPVFASDTALRTVDALLHPMPPVEVDFVGEFDPARLTGFSEASKAPLETYQAPLAAGADEQSRKLLGGQALLPNSNPSGYLSQPPLLLTTMTAATHLLKSTAQGPISAVRVRVAGVEHFDAFSREHIRLVAEQIALATGLDVDITVGASPSPQTVLLPAGKFGRPELTLAEGWSRKGVAVAIIQAIDRKSAILFGLILAVCLLFLGNALMAGVRSRRRELGVLACLGWPRRKLARLIVAEVGGLGLLAGIASALLAWPLAASAGVTVSPAHLAAAIPIALGLSMVAAVVPAWQASRAAPAPCGRRPRRAGQAAPLGAAPDHRRPGHPQLLAATGAVGRWSAGDGPGRRGARGHRRTPTRLPRRGDRQRAG